MFKRGTHSVGVQVNTPAATGKITNCQLAVTLSVATATAHLPIDADLDDGLSPQAARRTPTESRCDG